jgi:hypothetical protein
MASIIQQMKNNLVFKVNSMISNPEADAYAKKQEEEKNKEAERAAREKETAERMARQKAKSKKETEKLLKTEPGIHRIESIYTKPDKDGDDEEYVDVSWKPWPNGNKDANYNAKKRDFDALVNSVDAELLKTLYATYEKEKKQAEERARKANFSVQRLAKTSWDTFLSIFFSTVKILLGILAVSFATNLNLYKQWPYRLLYAIFAYRFWFVVIPYVLLYRWAWLKKQPKFYSLIPMVPLRFENRLMAQFFSWLSFKPDDEINAQREWITWKKEQDKEEKE